MSPEKVEELMRLHTKSIRRYLNQRMGISASEIDDVAQELWMRLLKYDGPVEMEKPFAYLKRSALHVHLDERERARNSKLHEPLEEFLEQLVTDEPDSDHAILSAQLQLKLRIALSRLPPRQREVLLMAALGGLTYKEIAQNLGLTYRIVLRDLTKAYSALRIYLNPKDFL